MLVFNGEGEGGIVVGNGVVVLGGKNLIRMPKLRHLR